MNRAKDTNVKNVWQMLEMLNEFHKFLKIHFLILSTEVLESIGIWVAMNTPSAQDLELQRHYKEQQGPLEK